MGLVASCGAGGQALDDHVQRAVIEEGACISILATKRGDDSMHGRLVAVVGPSLHQIADIAHVRIVDGRDVMPRVCCLVQDFESANCLSWVSDQALHDSERFSAFTIVLEQQGQRSEVGVRAYAARSPSHICRGRGVMVRTTQAKP